MKKTQTHMPYGFIIGLILVVINAVMVVTKMNLNPKMQWIGFVGYAFFLGGLIMNASAFSKANDTDITFGQAFGSCFKASAIVAIVLTAWVLLSIFIFPNMIPDMLEMARTKMAEGGKLSEEQIEMAMSYTRKSFKLLMIAGTVFGTLIMGAIFSLIAAAVAKKNPRTAYPA